MKNRISVLILASLVFGFSASARSQSSWTSDEKWQKTNSTLSFKQVSAIMHASPGSKDSKTAWGIDTEGDVYRTQDAGSTWSKIPITSPPGTQFSDGTTTKKVKVVSALTAKTAYAVTEDGRLAITRNEGEKWTLYSKFTANNGNLILLNYVSAIDETSMWLLDDRQRVLLFSLNGPQLDQPDHAKRLVQIASWKSGNLNYTWGVDASNKVYLSTDMGKNWNQPNEKASLVQVSATWGGGWGVNSKDKIWRSDNDGKTWHQPHKKSSLRQISVIDNWSAWGVNSKGDVYILSRPK